MNISQSRRLIAVSAMVTFSLGTVASIKRTGDLPTARFIVGYGVAFTIVSIMADLGSPVGGGFAALIMVSSIIYNADDVIEMMGFHTEPTITPTKAKKITTDVVNKRTRRRTKRGKNPIPKFRP